RATAEEVGRCADALLRQRGMEAGVLPEEDRTHAVGTRGDRAQGSRLRANRPILPETARDYLRPGRAQPADSDQPQGGADLLALFRSREPERRHNRSQDRQGYLEVIGGKRMASKSTIEWTEMTWNPVTGCTKVSEGCRHCYAERLALRLRAMGNRRY